METQNVLRLLAKDQNGKRFADSLINKKSDIVVDGLIGSSAALLFASTVKTLSDKGKTVPPLLFIMDDEEEAGYFYHDLTQMLGDTDILFFPSSYRRAIKYNQKDDANIVLRTNVLTSVCAPGGGNRMIVTYPDALAERVISRQQLSADTINISKGEEMDISELETRLTKLGFQCTDYVYEPGQFAIRGSIVDIFSFSNDEPYRIDFFGDEVDSIRTFDTQSQLSVDRMDTASIVPALKEQDNNQYIHFISFLPEDTVIVAHDLRFVADKIELAKQSGFSRQAVIETRSGQDNPDSVPETAFIASGEEFEGITRDKRKITAAKGRLADTAIEKGRIHIPFDTTAQPLFHKNMEMMTAEFERLIGEGYSIMVFADSEKQTQRLEGIFDANRKGEAIITFSAVNKAIHEGFSLDSAKLCLYTDHQIFDRYHKYNLKSDKARKGKVALTLKEIQQFEIGDYVVHIDHGIGKFGGLVSMPSNGQMQEMIKLIYQNDDIVYVSIHSLGKVAKYKGKEGAPPKLSRIGTGAWDRMKERVKTKVKDIARDLIRLYSQRQKEKGFAFSHDSYMQHELEASFVYEDTPDQIKATQDVKADMEKPQPMDRLVCGDVGFGKTEVAIRAAFKAATDGKQVAVLVPTTVLAYQHYNTFSNRLKDFPVRIEYLSRARDSKASKGVLQDLKDGKVDIIIGTHKLIGKEVKFKDLGLLIIDEEQKFGVAVKEKLRQMKINVDTLTMTATPIPRTLQFSLMGARDLSIIQTPPPNRYPIQTEIHTFSPEIIAEAINFEMSRNGQVFLVNNKISNLGELKDMINRYVPDARVCVGHGQMSPQELEKIVYDFMNHDYDVLLSTTIVENGIDIPNANTIIINAAHNFGLSDLHQMRGRVGRGNRKAFCYLLAPPLASLNDESRRRLQALENFSELGSGLQIAMQDLDIRGAGNLLGAEQSGFIADLGYETYQKVLAEAMDELRDEIYDTPATTLVMPDVFVRETTVDSDLAAYLPETYVPSSSERMSLYRELDNLTRQEQLDEYTKRLLDRFGELPHEAEELLRILPLKWTAASLGFEKVTLKAGKMILYMVSNFNSPYYDSKAFEKVIDYVSYHPGDARLSEHDKKRTLEMKSVRSISDALAILTAISGKENDSDN